MTASGGQDSAGLAGLRRVYPGWRIWRGETTGEFWAAPPAGHPHRALVNAPDIDGLAARLGELSIGRPEPVSCHHE